MNRVARRVHVDGVVQGVGFRPFVCRLAVALGLDGHVANVRGGVEMTVEGEMGQVEEFLSRLPAELPAPGCVERVEAIPVEPVGLHGFEVLAPDAGTVGPESAPIAPDIAVCASCLAELADASDRRFGYALIGCAQCGPRYTVSRRTPYDRAWTAMRGFPMCEECRHEFETPSDRRFHAELNACVRCGPTVVLLEGAGQSADGDGAVRAAADVLRGGGIVAVKGIGGFHIACDATNPDAVRDLRVRKRRPHRPLAVMVPDIEAAASCAVLDTEALALLTTPAAPIVVVPRRAGAPLAREVAPHVADLGLFLPYTPVHRLLLDVLDRPVVLTSANHTDRPITYEDGEAVEVVGPITDAILTHDRPIVIRCDDSVVRRRNGRTIPIRRSRGYVPGRIRLPCETPVPVLGVGGQLKCTAALARGEWVTPSHHIGDLASHAGGRALVEAIDHLRALTGIEPEVVAHDLHPDYTSTQLARDLDMDAVGVQHHHAHVASCLVENGCAERVLGVAFDGHGYGTDGMSWGGEFLVADLTHFERAACLRPVALPGGESAIRDPNRMAVAWLTLAAGPEAAAAWARGRVAAPAAVVSLCLDPSRVTTGAGRLFDAVAALVGLGSDVSYEGRAAAELEALAHSAASRHGRGTAYEMETVRGAMCLLDPVPAIRAVAEDSRRGRDPAEIAYRFHVGFAAATARTATHIAGSHDLDTVALSGGVFQNALFLEEVTTRLEREGLRILAHHRVPPNDGGLSLGQVAVAAARSRRGTQTEPP
ncbi:MAG: carbamoyltransferase HypF [Acidimicrobiia bacterium]|nr:carbamoyltransferase HypF [Acidimicrobiia bacterium]